MQRDLPHMQAPALPVGSFKCSVEFEIASQLARTDRSNSIVQSLWMIL